MSASQERWDPKELTRAKNLATRLRAPKMFAVRAPGRVNLIGEHTDYSNLPVMPIAIDRSTIIVAAARDDASVELRNVDANFPAREFRLEERIPPFASGDWANYVKAGFQGVIDHFIKRAIALEALCGATMIVDGQVPPAAGLSSSAALTVSAALALMAINGLAQAPFETAQMVARSEWYVGTMAGGMDQAASMLGQRDHALLIHFDPLRVTPVPMPAGAAIIVADSLEVADKSGKVRDEYNRRVAECAAAAQMLAQAYALDDVRVLGDIVKKLPGWQSAALLTALARKIDPASAEFRRARHVLTETERVGRAGAALASGRLEEMGALMNASHQSLRDDFDVSTPALDAMVACALDAGALGARLTGAGFGGCIIALARETDTLRILESMEKNYYAKLSANAAQRALHTVVHAGPGAGVIEL